LTRTGLFTAALIIGLVIGLAAPYLLPQSIPISVPRRTVFTTQTVTVEKPFTTTITRTGVLTRELWRTITVSTTVRSTVTAVRTVALERTRIIRSATTRTVTVAGPTVTKTLRITVVSTRVVPRLQTVVIHVPQPIYSFVAGLRRAEVSEDEVAEVLSAKPSTAPPTCPKSRRVFSPEVIAAALSRGELRRVEEIARSLRVPGDPLGTAMRVAEWIAKNIRYEPDTRFGVEECVLLPSETLELGSGDCEDLSLLEAAMLLASGEVSKAYLISVEYGGAALGHVDAAVEVGGKLYVVPWRPGTYPHELFTDYCGAWRMSGLLLKSIRPYAAVLGSDGLEVYVGAKEAITCHDTYPPPIPAGALSEIELELGGALHLNSSLCPRYVWEQAELLGKAIYLPYLRISIPVDWYSEKSRSWIADHVLRYVERFMSAELKEFASKAGCVVPRAVIGRRVVEVYKYGADGSIRLVEEPRVVIDLYLFKPYSFPTPHTEVVLTSDRIVVRVEAPPDNISILLYRLGEKNPIVGVAPPGAQYPKIKTVEASKWVREGGWTVIEIDKQKLFKELGKGVYELIVWVGDAVTYVKLVEVP